MLGETYNRDGELRIHTKFLLENMKRGDLLGDVDIYFVDENEP